MEQEKRRGHTVVIVENVIIAILQHALSTRSIDIPVRAVDKLSSAIGECCSAFVDKRAARALRAADVDAISDLY